MTMLTNYVVHVISLCIFWVEIAWEGSQTHLRFQRPNQVGELDFHTRANAELYFAFARPRPDGNAANGRESHDRGLDEIMFL